MEGALGPVGFVAGALGGQLGGPADAVVAVGDLIGGLQGERDLLGGECVQQPGGDRGIDGGREDRPAGRRGQPVGAGAAFIGGPLIAMVVGAHRLAAAAAADDPLAERGPLTRGPGPGVGPVGLKLGLVGQVVSPADVAGVMLLEQRRPLVAGLFHDKGVHLAVGIHGAPRAVPPEHVRAGVARVLQDRDDAGVGEPPQRS